MDASSLLILQEILTGLQVAEAAKPYLDKIAALNSEGATGEAILAAVQQIRKDSEAKLDADIAKAP